MPTVTSRAIRHKAKRQTALDGPANAAPAPSNIAEDALIADMLSRIDDILDATARITERMLRNAA